jgi:hypothetical protein
MRRVPLLFIAVVLTCCGRVNGGLYGRLSMLQSPVLIPGATMTLSFTRFGDAEPAEFTARALACVPREACEAVPLPSVEGAARFAVTVMAGQTDTLVVEPIIERTSDGVRFGDEFQVEVDPFQRALVRLGTGALTPVTQVALVAGDRVELCAEVSTASGRFVDLMPEQIAVELPSTGPSLVEERAVRRCRTFRAEGHGRGTLTFTALGQRLPITVDVISMSRVQTFAFTEVTRQGGTWATVGPVSLPLQATRGSLYRYYSVEGVADDGLRLPLSPSCLTIGDGTVDRPDPSGAPFVFNFWMTRSQTTLRWSSQCPAAGVALEGTINR